MIAVRMACHSFFGATLCLFLLLCFMPFVIGHARLYYPPSRASMWRFGFQNNKPNHNDNQGYCGGYDVMQNIFNGKCGVCGDPWLPRPRLHERGGKYYTGEATAYFKCNSVITAVIHVTANHKGFFEFRVCPYDRPKPGDLELYENGTMIEVSQSCLDKNILSLAHKPGTKYYLPPDSGVGFFTVPLRLPRGLRCRKCLFQWRYKAGNSWGVDSDGKSCIGCGTQEEFKACADIVIGFLETDTLPPATTTDKTVTKKKTTVTMPTKRCCPTQTYAKVPNMVNWCNINCSKGFCPKTHCVCNTL